MPGKVGKVLITGGLGYLGGRLATALLEKAWEVTVTSRKSKESLSRKVLETLPSIVNLTEEFSRTDSARFLSSFDSIVHLAAMNEHDSLQFPEAAMKVNVGDTARLLDSAVKAGVKQFIYLSTFHVYGTGINEKIDENHECRPMHPYSITHLAAEEFILDARKKGKIDGICLRLSNSYGFPAFDTADRWTLLVNDLCMQCVRDKQIILRSSGEQMRDFITITDFTRAVEMLLKQPIDRTSNGIYNLGSGKSTSVFEMSELIAITCEKELGFKPEIKTGSGGESNQQMVFDIQKIKNLGFQPGNEAEMEIAQTLHYCTELLKR